MPLAPGLVALPSVALNAALSLLPERTCAVRAPDRLAVIAPMYNEEAGAARALASLLAQSEPPEQLAVSINGGSDDTYGVVTRLLAARGFARRSAAPRPWLEADEEEWQSEAHPTRVTLLNYRVKTSKADSINNLVVFGIVSAERVLIVDGDTVFHPDFVRHLRENFYRLRRVRMRGETRLVLEDYGLQSGAVTSLAPAGSSLEQRFISKGREAEYAFAGVLRRGQARQLGAGRVFGDSRLYTVVGCGFAARRDLFPMPIDTETEDHDFTLAVQNRPCSQTRTTMGELERRGFRFVTGGQVRRPLELFDAQDEVILRRGGNARFVERALMATEDPPHFNGFIRQLERWHGGGQQSALKRLGQRLAPNVSLALYASLVENLLGLALLALLPILLALHYGNPSLGLPSALLASWLGADALVSALVVGWGFYRQRRALGRKRVRALAESLGRSLVATPPFLALRYLNPITYLASATRTLPEHWRARRRPLSASGVVWERSFARHHTRSRAVFGWTLAAVLSGALGTAALAPRINPINTEAWRLVNARAALRLEDFDQVALLRPAPEPGAEPSQPELSNFCPAARLPSAAPEPRRLLGDPEAYQPLSRWGLLTLARLAPLLPYLENAATAYDVPAELLLQVLLNESYLDPLAVGETGDKGLAQVTSDALTLLKGLSSDPQGRWYNPALVPPAFSVFDPDFSVCAGAAKLAWARAQPGVTDARAAYALYINPVQGFVNGRVSDVHAPLTEAMLKLTPMVESLAAARALYRLEPDRLTDDERRLFNIATFERLGYLSLEQAYRESYQVVRARKLDDGDLYENLLARYFGDDALMADVAP